MTNPRRRLLAYAEFLKQSGVLYVEGAEPASPASGFAPATPEPEVPPPMPPPPKRESALNGTSPHAPGRPKKPAAPSPAPVAAAVAAPAPPKPPRPAIGDLPREERVARLAAAAARADACIACALGKMRKASPASRSVYGVGNPEAKIVFVGEGPGGEEDRQGIPFVGRAGELLTKMVEAIGFRRDEIYICNTVKCRPPENRDPTPAEKEACRDFLIEQLEILRPQILVGLGAHAAQYLAGREDSIGRLRGKWHEYRGILVRATYHPAYLLRSPSMKAGSWEDFREIHAKYEELNPGDPRKIWKKGGSE